MVANVVGRAIVVVAGKSDNQSFSKIGRDIGDDLEKGARKGTGALSGLITKSGIAALGLAGLARAGVDFVQSAIDDEKSAAIFAKALQTSANATAPMIQATEDWIAAQGRALGVTDDDLRPALARLVRSTGDVAEAQSLASLALDISAATSKDLQTVSEALAKGHDGQTGALRRLGLGLDTTKDKSSTYAEIAAEAHRKVGSAAQTAADTTQGSLDRIQTGLNEAEENIGKGILEGLDSALKEKGGKGGGLDNFLTSLDSISTGVGAVLGGIVGQSAKLISDLTSLFNGDLSGVMHLLLSIVSGPLALVQGLFKDLPFKIGQALGNLGPKLKQIFSSAFSGIGSFISSKITSFVDLVKGLPAKIGELGIKMKDAGKALITKFGEGLSNVGGFIASVGRAIARWVALKLNAAIPNSLGPIPLPANPIPVPAAAQGVRNFRGGQILVGENGPELATLPRGSRVDTASNTRNMLEDSGGDTVVVNQNFYGPTTGAQRLQEMRYAAKYSTRRRGAPVTV